MSKLYNMDMSCLLLSTLGGCERFTLGGRDTLCKVGPHDIKRSSVLISDRDSSVMSWDYIPELLHSGLIRKMNQDIYVCSTLTFNIMWMIHVTSIW